MKGKLYHSKLNYYFVMGDIPIFRIDNINYIMTFYADWDIIPDPHRSREKALANLCFPYTIEQILQFKQNSPIVHITREEITLYKIEWREITPGERITIKTLTENIKDLDIRVRRYYK